MISHQAHIQPLQFTRSNSWCLFLDVDGTLVETAVRPDRVFIGTDLLDLMADLHAGCGGALALISGRTIEEIDHLFAPLQLPAAGVHGAERRCASGQRISLPTETVAFGDARNRLNGFVSNQPGLLLEDKGCALALHCRQAPSLASRCQEIARSVIANLGPSYELLEGDQVFEIKPAIISKATAVRAFMEEPPFDGRKPIFIGNDVTDLDGFEAVRKMGGLAVSVGSLVTAETTLADPGQVRVWLRDFLAYSRPPS